MRRRFRAAMTGPELIHATGLVVAGRGIVLRGEPGAGKSDLAFCLIERYGIAGRAEPAAACLIGDDYLNVWREQDALIGAAPETISGKIELRGIGIVTLPHVARARLELVIDLVARDAVERLPEPGRTEIAGIDLPCFRLHAFDASTAAKIRILVDLID